MNPEPFDKWRALVRRTRAQDGEELVFGPGASEASLDLLEKSLKFRLPPEFRELYRECDGAGTPREGGGGWFFTPLAGIRALAEDHNWFAETHPKLAARFMPFIDWGTGDTVGYLFDETGSPLPGLYEFEHDDYAFELDQDWREFLQTHGESLESFLLNCLQ